MYRTCAIRLFPVSEQLTRRSVSINLTKVFKTVPVTNLAFFIQNLNFVQDSNIQHVREVNIFSPVAPQRFEIETEGRLAQSNGSHEV